MHKTCSFPRLEQRISTGCTQLLRIQFTLDAADCSPDVGVDTRLFFDLFNGVDGGGVVLASKLFGNLWEAEMQLTSEHIHSHLAGDNNIFVALWP